MIGSAHGTAGDGDDREECEARHPPQGRWRALLRRATTQEARCSARANPKSSL